MKTIINIAGTSAGGSSYSLRIMNALSRDFSQDIEVVIGKGVAQQVVYELVLNRALELHQFVNQVGGSIKQNIQVTKE